MTSIGILRAIIFQVKVDKLMLRNNMTVHVITPESILQAGCGILDPIMNFYGFTFIGGESGIGSGGTFTRGDYVRDDRRLELHFRYTLGLVTYHIGSSSASHRAYMYELLGADGGNHYPRYSDNPLDAFLDLAHDLQNFASDFLSDNGERLIRASLREAKEKTMEHKTALSRNVGDTRKREEAHRLFYERNFQGVIERLDNLLYPELMTESERKMLEMSKRRI
jgi:hypothetical protein